MEVIITSPLILGYKYEKLKEEMVVEREIKKLGKGEKIEWSKGRVNYVESLC